MSRPTYPGSYLKIDSNPTQENDTKCFLGEGKKRKKEKRLCTAQKTQIKNKHHLILLQAFI